MVLSSPAVPNDHIPRLARPRILSLDGGGEKAVVTLGILDFIEERLNLEVRLRDSVSADSVEN